MNELLEVLKPISETIKPLVSEKCNTLIEFDVNSNTLNITLMDCDSDKTDYYRVLGYVLSEIKDNIYLTTIDERASIQLTSGIVVNINPIKERF